MRAERPIPCTVLDRQSGAGRGRGGSGKEGKGYPQSATFRPVARLRCAGEAGQAARPRLTCQPTRLAVAEVVVMAVVVDLFDLGVTVLEVFDHVVGIETVVLGIVEGAINDQLVSGRDRVGLVGELLDLGGEGFVAVFEGAVAVEHPVQAGFHLARLGLRAHDAFVVQFAAQIHQLGAMVLPDPLKALPRALQGVCGGLCGPLLPFRLRLPAQAKESPSAALRERHSGFGVHDVGVDPLDALMGGLGALDAAYEAMILAHRLGEVGLHGGELLAVADQGAGVELALLIEGDGHDGHVRGGLVAVNHGGEDVFGPVAFLEPVEGGLEIGVLFGPGHGAHGLGTGADEVFQPVDGVRPDFFGCARFPGVQNIRAGGGAVQDGVVVDAAGIGVRGFPFAEGVLEAGPHVAEVLDLGAAQDGEAALTGAAAPALAQLKVERVIFHRTAPSQDQDRDGGF